MALNKLVNRCSVCRVMLGSLHKIVCVSNTANICDTDINTEALCPISYTSLLMDMQVNRPACSNGLEHLSEPPPQYQDGN